MLQHEYIVNGLYRRRMHAWLLCACIRGCCEACSVPGQMAPYDGDLHNPVIASTTPCDGLLEYKTVLLYHRPSAFFLIQAY